MTVVNQHEVKLKQAWEVLLMGFANYFSKTSHKGEVQKLVTAMTTIGPNKLHKATGTQCDHVCDAYAHLLATGMPQHLPRRFWIELLKQKPSRDKKLDPIMVLAEAVILKLSYLEKIPVEEWLKIYPSSMFQHALGIINLDLDRTDPCILRQFQSNNGEACLVRKYLGTGAANKTAELWQEVNVQLARVRLERGIAGHSKRKAHV